MAGPRHRQASKTWKGHSNKARGGTKRAQVQERWKAVNMRTHEYCPHYHHSRASALRCGATQWETDYKAIRWRS